MDVFDELVPSFITRCGVQLPEFFSVSYFLRLSPYVLFVKAAKILASSLAVAPLSGCAVATGMIYGCFLVASSYAPDKYSTFFGAALLAFALIETFCFMAMGLVAYILVL